MNDLACALQISVDDLPAEEAVSDLIEHAATLGVSDLFFACHESHVMVSARHLGILRPITHLTGELGRRCLAHIKALAMLDIAEHRRPQDGRWYQNRPSGDKLDLRVSILPTLYGEDLTLRLLDRTTRVLNLDQLGLQRRESQILQNMLSSPSGLILVTGPTGSGKTTTLYGCLNYLNNGQRKLNTIEDPVEYAIGGIRQSQVNAKLGVGFAELLRCVLRQAPDVIMIGEIRDPETAATAVLAANSGHLVLATLHAPTAPAAVQSMFNFGVFPHFLAGGLLGVITQRLVRTLCPHCRQAFDMSDAPHTFAEVRTYLQPSEGYRMFGPKGCPECRFLGYAGRTGVFEILQISSAIRRLILERPAAPVIRQQAVAEGLVECRLSAMIKVARGETSVEEVFRTIPPEYLALEE